MFPRAAVRGDQTLLLFIFPSLTGSLSDFNRIVYGTHVLAWSNSTSQQMPSSAYTKHTCMSIYLFHHQNPSASKFAYISDIIVLVD